MAWKLANFAQSTLSQAIAAGDTTIYIDADEVDDLPVLGVGDKAKLVAFNADYSEIMNITAWNTNGTLTVERGQEGTTARAWSAGVKVVCTPTAEVFAAILAVPPAVVFTGSATNVGNAYEVDVGASNPIPTLTNGEEVSFVIPADNTGAVTLVITDGTSSTTSKPVVYHDDQPLLAGDFAADWLAQVRFSSDFDAWVIISDTSHQDYITTINEGPLGSVNRHPNGRFDAWNNGTTFSTPATETETADGVSVQYDGTIGAFSVSRQAFTPGQTDVPGNPRYFLRWDQSNAGSASTIRRWRARLGGVGWRAGETVTRSVWLKADTARNVTARLIQHFGTGGGPSADVTVDSDVLALTTSWQRFDITSTLPSIATKTIGSNGDDALWLTLDLPVNVTMTIDVAQDDFRPGQLAGRFSDLLPLPWWQGGVGGSFDSAADFLLTLFPQLSSVNLLGTLGMLTRTAANTIVARSLTTATSGALTITNPAGTAGNPNIDVSTGLVNYAADPMSVAELASITGVFGTAAFVADNTLAHLAGIETFTANKNFRGAVDAALLTIENTTTTNEMEARWTSVGTVFELTPSPAGTPDATKGFGYDVTNTRWFVDTNLLSSGVHLGPGGAVGAPAYSFSGDPNTGIWNRAADQIGFAAGGADIFNVQAGGIEVSTGRVFTPTGSVGAPAYTFTADPDSGLYRIGADNIGFAVNGALQVDINATRMLLASGFDIQLNSATGPLATTSLGFRGAPVISGEKSGAYSHVLADSGGAIPFTASATFTIATNSAAACPIGTVLFVPNLNGSGNITIHPDTGVTLRRGDGTAGTGDRTLPPDAAIWLWKRGTNEWYIYGVYT